MRQVCHAHRAHHAKSGQQHILAVMVPNEQRLFTPGTGAMPPELSGRGAQQAVLSRCLADLVGGSAPPHNVVLLGPHGNGKTEHVPPTAQVH